jgi:hypothetical protein
MFRFQLIQLTIISSFIVILGSSISIKQWYEYTGLNISSYNDKNISLSKLIKLIPSSISNRIAINIGARDGIDHDPVYELYHQYGYTGILFEGDPKMLPILRNNMMKVNNTGKIYIIEEFARVHKMASILKYFNIPKVFDVLKVDIDSYDYAILNSILVNGYLPRIVLVEMNVDIPPPIQWYLDEKETSKYEQKYGWFGSYGGSTDAFFDLMSRYDYRLIDMSIYDEYIDPECARCEHNLWFIRNDISQSSVPAMKWIDMNALYWYRQDAMYGKKLPICLHMKHCPVQHMKTLFGKPMHGFDASIALLEKKNNETARQFLQDIMKHMYHICGTNCHFYSGINQLVLDRTIYNITSIN